MTSILKNLDAYCKLQKILPLRLVSNSWRAAVSEYNGKISLEAHRSNALFETIRLLPCISELTLDSDLDICMSPVAALSHLSCLRYHLSGYDDLAATRFLDITLLPANLVCLHLYGIQVDSDCYKYIKCVFLTKLALHLMGNLPAEQCELLQYLPKLQLRRLNRNCVCIFILTIARCAFI